MSTFREPYLIAGYRGMLGTELTGYLGRSGIEVVTVGHEELDIRFRDSVADVLSRHRPGVVFNAAALTDVDGCETAVDEAFAVNAQGPGNLAQACAETGAFLVHVSTDYVFDGCIDRAYSEDDDVNPLGVYGKSKAQGENALRAALADSHIIVRTQWLFGLHGRNFVEAVLDQAVKKGSLRVVNDQYGSPTYTVDLARAMVQLAHSGATGTFHVTNRGTTTWRGFAEKIVEMAELSGVPVQPIDTWELDRPAPRPKYAVLDNGKFIRRVGRPLRTWEEALGDYMLSRTRS